MIPSYLKQKSGSAITSNAYNNNTALKCGRIIAAHYPDKDRQKIGIYYMTYDVLVRDFVGGAANSVVYYECRAAEPFGGAADFCQYSYRPIRTDYKSILPVLAGDDRNENSGKNQGTEDTTAQPKQDEAANQIGAQVILACVNGSSDSAVIIAGLAPTEIQKNKLWKMPEENKRFLSFSFNGIDISINDDGELSLTRKGPNNDVGELLKKDQKEVSDAVDSAIKINKLGTITVTDGKGENLMEIIPKDGQLNIKVKKNYNIECDDINMGGKGLGDSQKVAIEKLVKDEIQKVRNYIDSFKSNFNTHTHPSPAGPTSPPTVPFLNPMQPMQSMASKVLKAK